MLGSAPKRESWRFGGDFAAMARAQEGAQPLTPAEAARDETLLTERHPSY